VRLPRASGPRRSAANEPTVHVRCRCQGRATAFRNPERAVALSASLLARASTRVARAGLRRTHVEATVAHAPAPPRLASACPCAGGCPRCVASSGQALPAALARSLGDHYGADLSGVRVHTGADAAHAVAAAGARRAFASGDHIVVGDPSFSPDRAAGRHLLAHEAAHVLQQRGGGGGRGETASLESEARRSADAFAAGRAAPPVRQGSAPAGLVQRDEPAPGAPSSPTLQLDPEIQAEIYVAQWLATHGEDATTSAPDPQVSAEPVPNTWLGPPRLGAETLDFGSLITPYYMRGLMPETHGDTRDLDVISSLFSERYRLVLRLPDLRAMAPGFARPWIPSDWRTKLAATMTSTTVDWALSHDHPTFFDLSNQAFERFTGATTYSLPMLPVPVLNDWWNRFSGGGK